jgi:sec-independent protein translocase protein TatB
LFSNVGLTELLVLFVIGLMILGPERLPKVASQIGRWVGRARRTANQLRYQLEREVALAEFESKKKDQSGDKPEAKAGSTEAAPGPAESQSDGQTSSADDSIARPEDKTAASASGHDDDTKPS